MKVAVLGGGAVGLGLASFLLAAGARVLLQVRRRDAAEALAREGLRRTGIFGERVAPPESFAVATSAGALPDFDPDAILVCTKSNDCDAAAEWLRAAWPALPREPAVVLCLNGWGHAERFALSLPRERVFSAAVTTGFRRHGPCEVEITVHGATLRMGSLFGEDPAPLAELCALLTRGGLPSETSPDMEAEVWAKLLYNCALNPLAALLDVPYGALGEDPHRRAILERVVGEVFAVLAARGGRTRWRDADAYLEFFFRELLPATRDHESSMLQDLRAGRPTEIDALSGAVARLGAEHGVPTPVNAALATLVRARHPTDAAGAGRA